MDAVPRAAPGPQGRPPRLGERLSLRARLVASLLILLAAALAGTSLAATQRLRGYLLDRVDQRLETAAVMFARPVSEVAFPNATPPGRLRGGPALPSAFYVEYLDANGATVLQLRNPLRQEEDSPRLPGLPVAEATLRAGPPFTVGGDASDWRVVVRPLGALTLVVAAPLADVQATIARLLMVQLAVGAAVLTVFAVLGLVAVRTSLRPLARIEETAEAIAAGDLSRRVPVTAPSTEVGRLSRALNGMLAQIESAFRARADSEARMRRFVADASHELRTPLTSIRGFAELYRQGAVNGPGEVARLMRRIEHEAVRMGGLVDDLLLLARLDQQRPLKRERVNLAAIAFDAVHDASALSAGRRIVLEPLPEGGNGSAGPLANGLAQPVWLLGDEARLRQVAGNLVVNAVQHTPPRTPVTVRVGTRDGQAVLEVSDQGPGLDAEQARRVFERFYRADSSRKRSSGGGAGLGLSIVSAIVSAHDGEVRLDTAPGRGATFRVLLPLHGASRAH